MKNKSLYDLFKNPSAEYRGKPFWSWNGKLEKQELLRQIQALKDMGMGGYFCHSRTGLETEYLGDEWFKLIDACANEGQNQGMETWLYDEDRWPSATAGGMVTKDPQNRMKYIRLNISQPQDFKFDDSVISAFSADVDGLAFYNKQSIVKDAYLPDNLTGKTILWFSIEEMGASSFYNGYTYADTMRRETTQEFIRITHEKYRKNCGEHFGSTIKGIFTDEPHRGAVMSGFQLNNRQADHLTPYTDKLFELFKKIYGYDLIEFLPELFLYKDGQAVSLVKWQYMELIQQLFLQNYLTPISEWCHKNNMLLTGHLLQEDSLTSQADMIGSVMRGYELMDYPGVDILTKGNYNYKVVKQLQSVGRQLNKPWLMSELYGCTGWEYTFADHKYMGDWQALLGINLRCHHLSWYTMEGEAKRDYPASISYQSAWYKQYKYVEDYFSRLAVALKDGDPCCDVLVIHPVESAWSVIHAEWSKILSTEQEDVRAIETDFKAMCQMLLDHQIDFDYGDEDIISRLGSVEIEQGVPVLKIGFAKYKTVVLGSMLTIRGSTLNLLQKFIELGGNVIQSGREADYVDALPSDKLHNLPINRVDFCAETLIPALDSARHIKIYDNASGTDSKGVFAQLRKDEQQMVIMLLNTDKNNAKDISVTIDAEGHLEEWDARTGDKWYIGYYNRGDSLKLNLCKAQEKILVVQNERGNSDCKPTNKTVSVLPTASEFEYSLSEPNVCVLDVATYRIDNGEWSKPTEILRVDRQLREHYGLSYRTGVMLQPWFTKDNKKIKYGTITLNFEFFVDALKPIKLGIEHPERYDIKLNGYNVSNNTVDGWWVDKCIKTLPLDIKYLKKGINQLECTFDFYENVGIEAMYLLGDFGVELDGVKKTLVPLPQKLSVGDVREQGLPFYGSGICYRISDIPLVKDGQRIVLQANDISAACIKVHNPNGEKIIAFNPLEADITDLITDDCDYVDVEYILTRRNTFGPLHVVPTVLNSYNPTTFVTAGNSFREDGYSLIGQGMTSALNIKILDIE